MTPIRHGRAVAARQILAESLRSGGNQKTITEVDMLKKTMAVSAATVAMVMGTSSMAMADNTAISIEKNATRSASHMVLRIQATIVCSPDTTDSALSAQVSQTNAAGGTQTANATWVNLGGAEC